MLNYIDFLLFSFLFTRAVISESESEKESPSYGSTPAAPVGVSSLLSDAIRMYTPMRPSQQPADRGSLTPYAFCDVLEIPLNFFRGRRPLLFCCIGPSTQRRTAGGRAKKKFVNLFFFSLAKKPSRQGHGASVCCNQPSCKCGCGEACAWTGLD